MTQQVGMFVDTSLCIGCKACQVACKEWNGLPVEKEVYFTGHSYDNTKHLSAYTWRHVKFIEQFNEDRTEGRWLFLSDSCKHCNDAPCMEVCPTDALVRTEFGTVFVDQDVCIGCANCVAACPFGVIQIEEEKGVAQKCTLCYDRLQNGQEPACAAACPTGAIRFGSIDALKAVAHDRLETLHRRGETRANIYGEDILGGLNVFYLLLDKPAVYGLPEAPRSANKHTATSFGLGALGLAALGIVGLVSFKDQRMKARQEAQENKDETISS
ncbi:MAG: 4Fe-4S dicluster domain-containing protein [Candidatus Carbobacillus altaicus]|uniref:Formate dehydrogenase, beta subunit n=1 Tax=Candidatus Carbonibacillus altaicus TaxID=2163959 RepID=A0A2R6XYV5_9BACL|nr:4Fe-4S dicluster domain-containing protein [Candidatus Carbobacillus altaicus]PTQ55613.1 MAG: Formate dehydrogenase, beta subunit [Candidatus Carbobacillus altaicus]